VQSRYRTFVIASCATTVALLYYFRVRQHAKSDSLSARQQRFAVEYVQDGNATDAAVRAGYSANGAAVQGCRLLRNAKVSAAIEVAARARLDAIAEEGITGDRILREFARICRSDWRRLVDDQGNLLPIRDWPDDVASAIASVEITEGKAGVTVTKIKLWDKIAALTNMAKHFGLLKDLTEHSGAITYSWLGDDEPATG
jgi:phage terminase small subunit